MVCDGQGSVHRYGGEGFLAHFADIDIDQLTRLAEDIRRAVGQPIALYSTHPSFTVTASIGLAHSPEHGADLQTLLRSADEARHLAKRAGRNQVRPVSYTHLDVYKRQDASRLDAVRRPGGTGAAAPPAEPGTRGLGRPRAGHDAAAADLSLIHI